MRKFTALVLLVLIGFASSLGAGVLVYDLPASSPLFTSGTSTTSYPYNLANSTVQTNYTPTQMANTSGKIVAFGLQFTGAVTRTWPDVKIYMGEGDKTPATWSTTFAANANIVPDTLVFDGALSVTTTMTNETWAVDLDTPFNYSGQNTLVVTIRVAGSSTGTGTVTHLVAYSTAVNNLRMYSTSSATATTGSMQTGLGYGAKFHISAGTTWTGAISSDWNTAGNWEGDEVPLVDASVVIPDAATTANDPILPNGGACLDVTIEAGGILVGGSGELSLHGSWTNDGGVFVPGSSLIRYVGVDEQEITCGGGTVGSIRIEDTNHPVKVNDEWSSVNAGRIELVAGAEMTFLDPTIDFSNNTFDNQGQFNFGLTAGGTAPTLQSITTNGSIALGNVFIDVADAMDTVEFLGAANFNKLTLAGLGNVNFLSSVTIGDQLHVTMPGALAINGAIDGTGTLQFSSPSPIVIGGAINAGAMIHDGDGNLTLSGSVTLAGDCSFVSSGVTTQTIVSGNLNVGGDMIVNAGSVAAGNALEIGGQAVVVGATKIQDGVVTIANGLSTASFEMTSADDVTVSGGVSNLGSINFNSNASLTVLGFCTAVDVLTLGTGDVSLGSALTIAGDLWTLSSGNFEINGNLTLNGSNPQNLRIDASAILCARLVVNSASGATLTGPISCTSTSAFVPAVSVATNSGLVLGANASLTLGGPGGVGLADIRGAFTSTEGATASRPVIRAFAGASVAEFARVRFRSTSRLSLDGMTFNNVGSTAQSYGIEIDSGAVVSALNSIIMTGANANIAAISLASDDTPTIFQNISMDGTSAGNIDASTISGKRIEIRESKTGSGNLYGVPNEIDPNGVLFWENPPAVAILAGNILPSVLAETFFTASIPAVGGNAPMTYALLNAPAWMSIGAVTGEISGTPPRSAIGVHTFAILVADSSIPSNSSSSVFTMVVDSLTSVGVTIVSEPQLLSGKVGQGYGYSLSAAGGTGSGFTWSLVNPNSLPAGLHLSSDGVISGQVAANAAGLYNFAVTVQDAQGNASVKNFSITIDSEYSNPNTIAAALSDGPGGGGCALGAGSEALLGLLLALMALALFVRRRRMA